MVNGGKAGKNGGGNGGKLGENGAGDQGKMGESIVWHNVVFWNNASICWDYMVVSCLLYTKQTEYPASVLSRLPALECQGPSSSLLRPPLQM